MVIVSPYAGRLTARYGFRIVVTTGLALAGLGLLALGTVHADTGHGNVRWRPGVVGIDFALTMSPLTGAAIQAVSPQEGGLASGIGSTTRQIGAVLDPPRAFRTATPIGWGCLKGKFVAA